MRGKKTGGRDFQKGKPGGPGRPPLSQVERDVAEATRRELAEAMQGEIPRIRMAVKAAMGKAAQGDFHLLDRLLDRIIGKVPQRTELTGGDGGPVEMDVGLLSDDEVRRLVDTIRKRAKVSAPTDS